MNFCLGEGHRRRRHHRCCRRHCRRRHRHHRCCHRRCHCRRRLFIHEGSRQVGHLQLFFDDLKAKQGSFKITSEMS